MRYFIRPEDKRSKLNGVLPWLLDIDPNPNVLPIFPDDANLGLVVAHLVSGEVYAEVLPQAKNFVATCGDGFPMGRLYFQIPRDRLYSVCPRLTPEIFEG
jgi:hypothetical protein